VDIELKQYRDFGTKAVTLTNTNEGTTATTTPDRPAPTAPNRTQSTHTVVSGDTLWGIAQRKLGDGSRWRDIYNLNKETIESAARTRGLASSANGHWIFPGTVLRLPGQEQQKGRQAPSLRSVLPY